MRKAPIGGPNCIQANEGRGPFEKQRGPLTISKREATFIIRREAPRHCDFTPHQSKPTSTVLLSMSETDVKKLFWKNFNYNMRNA